MDYHAQRMEAAWTGTPASPAAAPHRLPLRFSGSGSEYFRIWIVNLLLTLVTLTLYAPFAKVRRLRWQYANTLVDGQPLGFHANPWAMLRGHVLVLVFGGLYTLAGRFSLAAGLLASAALAALWPALWQASLRYRLANSSWRGLRFQFTGSLGDAYWALAPMLLPAALTLALVVHPNRSGAPPPWYLGLAPAVAGLLWPWVSFRMKRYQHAHYHWGGQTTQLHAGLGAFYGVSLRAGLVTLGPVFVVGVLAAITMGAVSGRDGLGQGASMVWLLLALLALGYLMALLVGQAFLITRMQNLVWGHTRSAALRFHSALTLRPVALQLLKNLLLTLPTLGLYWPFGWVRLTALRLGAVHIEADEDPAGWAGGTQAQAGSAAGEAAGDLLDIDVGL